MKEITTTCDRCGKVIHGAISEEKEGTMTAGYYIVTEGYWHQFQRWDEERVCDKCMFTDPKYIAIYGKMTLAPDEGYVSFHVSASWGT